MKRNFIFLVVIVSVILFGAIVLWPPKKTPEVKIRNTTVFIEIAKTPEERSRGLSYRKSLPQDNGMLFIFPNRDYHSFWMKGMNFNLDFIWIDQDKIVDITKDVPFPRENLPDEALPTYRSKIPVDMMLEVNSGFVIENRIKLGDVVKKLF